MTSGSHRKQNPLPNRFFLTPEYIVWLRKTVGQQSAVAQLPRPSPSHSPSPPLAKTKTKMEVSKFEKPKLKLKL